MPTEKQKTVDNTQQNDKIIKDGSYIPFSAIKHSENKEDRVERTLEPLLRNHVMLLNRKFQNIIDQLAHFSKIGTNKDDDIDSLEMAVSRLKSFVEEDSGYENGYTPSEVISRFDGI